MNKQYVPKITNDPEAIALNRMLDDVRYGIEIGRWLLDLYNHRFQRNSKLFRKWVREHIDRDEQTLIRRMVLAQNKEELYSRQVVRLKEAYELLDLSGAITFERIVTLNS